MTIEGKILCECKAIYDYTAPDGSAENQLELRKGDRVQVYTQEASGWWNGMRISDNMTGWFPGSFVEQVPSVSAGLSVSVGIEEKKDVKWQEAVKQGEKVDSEWQKLFTENGDAYYVNSRTGQSSWTLPSSSSSVSAAFSSLNTRNPSNSVSGKSFKSILSDEGWDSVPISPSPGAGGYEDRLSSGVANTVISTSSIPSSKILASRKSSTTMSVNSVGKSSASPTQEIMSFIDPNPVSVATEGKYKYIDNFWSDKGGKSGFEILVLKHRNGKEVCKDVSAFMLERSRIEETYAKAMMDLANSTLGDLESGTAKTAWNQLKFDLKTQAKSRLEFSSKLMKEVQEPTMNFKNEQKKMRKNYEATIATDRKSMMAKFVNVQKMRKIYYQRAKEAEAADSLLQAYSQSPANAASRKDFLKAEETARRERKKASMAEYDYRTAVEDFEKVRSRWEDDMQSAFYEFQSAEEERLEFLGEILKSYLKIQKEVNEYCKGSSEMVESSIQSISKDVDIELFVKQHYTGGHRPLQLQFEAYQPRH